MQVRTILLSIQSLLGEPNNDSPLNTQAAELWSNQVSTFRLLSNHEESHFVFFLHECFYLRFCLILHCFVAGCVQEAFVRKIRKGH